MITDRITILHGTPISCYVSKLTLACKPVWNLEKLNEQMTSNLFCSCSLTSNHAFSRLLTNFLAKICALTFEIKITQPSNDDTNTKKMRQVKTIF